MFQEVQKTIHWFFISYACLYCVLFLFEHFIQGFVTYWLSFDRILWILIFIAIADVSVHYAWFRTILKS